MFKGTKGQMVRSHAKNKNVHRVSTPRRPRISGNVPCYVARSLRKVLVVDTECEGGKAHEK